MKGAHFYADASVTELYRWFAGEASGSSPTWVRVCEWVADSGALDDLLDTLPGIKRQPNLFLAALRFLNAPLDPSDQLAQWVRQHWGEVNEVVLTHATQTNEPGRCATLAPALAAIGGPIALIEVGASAGLCLTPDRYAYRYHREGSGITLLAPEGVAEPVVFDCEVSGAAGLPLALPQVIWRAGIDLNPLDPGDPGDARWLRALVWPDQPERERRLAAALGAVAEVDIHRVRGDALAELPALVHQAPSEATVVVIHSAVLPYLQREQRAEFAALMGRLGEQQQVRWLSNEGVRVLPAVAGRLADPDSRPGDFVLSLDGQPLARTGPHGQRLHWLNAH